MINMKSPTLKYFARVVFLIPTVVFLFTSNIYCQKKYTLYYILAGKDTSYKLQQLGLTTSFDAKEFAVVYVSALRGTLLTKGFPAGSVDSVLYD